MLPAKTIRGLHKIVAEFNDTTHLEKRANWKGLSDGAIWKLVVNQVAAVGGSRSVDRLADTTAGTEDWYQQLSSLRPSSQIPRIHKTLSAASVRYVTPKPDDCRKSKALAHNLRYMQRAGGPQAYVQSIAAEKVEHERVNRLVHELAYVKQKGARDLLISLGLASNVIAFDTRVINTLNALGASVPGNIAANPAAYRRLEEELVERVCKPLGITGARFDRILYQSYNSRVV